MSTINKTLPIFKNIQQKIINESSQYENIKPYMPLSRVDGQSSK